MVSDFRQYRRKHIAELRPYVPGEDLSGVSISAPDKEGGSPKVGDMIARNPKNHKDQWLVAEQYFKDNFEPIEASEAQAAELAAVKEMYALEGAKALYELERAEAAKAERDRLKERVAELEKALDALDRMNRGLDWCNQDEQARRWSAAHRALAGGQ